MDPFDEVVVHNRCNDAQRKNARYKGKRILEWTLFVAHIFISIVQFL